LRQAWATQQDPVSKTKGWPRPGDSHLQSQPFRRQRQEDWNFKASPSKVSKTLLLLEKLSLLSTSVFASSERRIQARCRCRNVVKMTVKFIRNTLSVDWKWVVSGVRRHYCYRKRGFPSDSQVWHKNQRCLRSTNMKRISRCLSYRKEILTRWKFYHGFI
jgi:hypothetical protein